MNLTHCPFCGSDAVELKVEPTTKYIECDQCGARGPSFNVNLEQIAARWNMRYEDYRPGTLPFRFDFISKYTEQKFHHSPFSAKGFEGTLTAGIEQLEHSLERMIGWADKFLSEADLGDDYEFEMHAYSHDKEKAQNILKGNVDV